MSVSQSAETTSVLHVLEARGFRGLHKVLSRLSQDFNLPIISLQCFDVQTAVDPLLPMDFMLRRGALVFELVGETALVAILNPCDETLRGDVKALTGRECHFFLALPSEFDDALTRLTEVTAV